MKKVEKELTEFFEKESESLRLPAEDEIKAIPAKRRKLTFSKKLSRIAAVIASVAVCLIVVTMIPVFNRSENPIDISITTDTAGDTTDINSTKEEQPSTPSVLTFPAFSEWLSNPEVVWHAADCAPEVETSSTSAIMRGTYWIDDALRNLMMGRGDSTVYAVTVDFSNAVDKSSDTEWTKDQYRHYLDSFKDSFEKAGLGIYTDESDLSITKMCFYTFATAEQLENFQCKSNETFIFKTAIKNRIINETENQS